MLNDDQKALIFMQAWDINPHPFLDFFIFLLFPLSSKKATHLLSPSLSLSVQLKNREKGFCHLTKGPISIKFSLARNCGKSLKL